MMKNVDLEQIGYFLYMQQQEEETRIQQEESNDDSKDDLLGVCGTYKPQTK